METQLQLPLQHQHHKKRSQVPKQLNTIEVDTTKQRPPKQPVNSQQIDNAFEDVSETVSKVYVEKKTQPSKENTEPAPPPNTISHPDRESKVLKDIASEKKQIDTKLQNILHHYKQINENEFLFSAHSPVKQQQIRSFLARLRKEKKQRQERIKNTSMELNGHSKDKTNEKAIMERKEQIEERYKRRLQQLESNEQHRREEHERFKEFYRNYKNSKPVFQQMEEEEKKVQELQQREAQAKLQKNAKRFKPISEEEFEEHVRRHQEALEQFQEAKKFERDKFLERIEEENEKLESIWRGHYYQQAKEERNERKRKLEAPKQKIQKIREYSLEVRHRYMPKTSTREVAEEEEDKPLTHRRVKRYKYYKGEYYGEVEDKLPLQHSEQEKRKIGNGYLEMVRNLPKKRTIPEPESPPPEPQTPKKKQPVPRQARSIDPLYESTKRINLGDKPTPESVQFAMYSVKNMDAKISRQQKVLRLERLPSVLEYQERQRAINMKLVRGIEEKLNLLAQM